MLESVLSTLADPRGSDHNIDADSEGSYVNKEPPMPLNDVSVFVDGADVAQWIRSPSSSRRASTSRVRVPLVANILYQQRARFVSGSCQESRLANGPPFA